MGASSDYMDREPYSGWSPNWAQDIREGQGQAGRRADEGYERGTETWGRQRGLAEQLAARARGDAPSAAEIQMQRGLGQASAQAQGAAAGARGMAPGLAQYMAGQQTARMGQETIGQTGVLRAQEQAQAEQALSQHLGGMGQQQLGQQQMYNSMLQNYINQGMSIEQAKQQAYQHAQQLEAGTYSHSPGMFDAGGAGWDLLKAGGTATAMLALSDKREKKDIKVTSDKDMDAFIGSLKGHSYKYKSKNALTPGKKDETQHGIIAQDLLESALGKAIIDKRDITEFEPVEMKPKKGKKKERLTLDTQKLTFSLAAALGRIGSRLDKIEGEK